MSRQYQSNLGTKQPRPWRNLAQGGESHAWRLAPTSNEVAQLTQIIFCLGPRVWLLWRGPRTTRQQLSIFPNRLSLGGHCSVEAQASYRCPTCHPWWVTTATSPANPTPQRLAVRSRKQLRHVSGQKGFKMFTTKSGNDLFGGWKTWFENTLDWFVMQSGCARCSGG